MMLTLIYLIISQM